MSMAWPEIDVSSAIECFRHQVSYAWVKAAFGSAGNILRRLRVVVVCAVCCEGCWGGELGFVDILAIFEVLGPLSSDCKRPSVSE